MAATIYAMVTQKNVVHPMNANGDKTYDCQKGGPTCCEEKKIPTADPTDMQTPIPTKGYGYGYGNQPTPKPSRPKKKKPKKPTTSSYGYISDSPDGYGYGKVTNAPTTDPTDMPTAGYGYNGYKSGYSANAVKNEEVSMDDAMKVVESGIWDIYKAHSWLIVGALIIFFLFNVLCCGYMRFRSNHAKKQGPYGFIAGKDGKELDESDVTDEDEQLMEEFVE